MLKFRASQLIGGRDRTRAKYKNIQLPVAVRGSKRSVLISSLLLKFLPSLPSEGSEDKRPTVRSLVTLGSLGRIFTTCQINILKIAKIRNFYRLYRWHEKCCRLITLISAAFHLVLTERLEQAMYILVINEKQIVF